MPRGDGTGPMRQGPLTGRGMGRCIGTTKQSETGQFSQGRLLPLISRIARFWQGRNNIIGQQAGGGRGRNRR